MYNVLKIGKTGIKSNQYKMDAIAENLANAGTHGYKNKEVAFQELLNNDEINVGSKASAMTRNFEQGAFTESSYDYHMAIAGNGFFGVLDENNTLMLTRNGGFHMNEDKSITCDRGYSLYINYAIPREEWPAEGVTIASKGEIRSAGGTSFESQQTFLGSVVLFNPDNNDSLISLGEGRYLPSANGQLYNSIENQEMVGEIHQHFLEASNVNLTQNFADMIIAQRAYSLSTKVTQTTDEMMTVINGIKR